MKGSSAPAPTGSERPVAKVYVEQPMSHLDRTFDYEIPDQEAADARPGVRVRVRFSGRLVSGYLVALGPPEDPGRRLLPLTKVISPEVVLLPEQVELVRRVADHWAGTFADVVRLAVPPRHAGTEQTANQPWPEPRLDALAPGGLAELAGGEQWLASLRAGESVRVCVQLPAAFRSGPGGTEDWTRAVLQACQATLASGRGVVVVVPDRRDLTRAEAVLRETLGPGCLAVLHTELGPSARYRNYLALARGNARIVLGTRSAVFAPVHELGLVIVVDDGNDLLAEPRAPYPHARDVAALRAAQQGCSLALISVARSCEAQAWVERGWALPIGLEPDAARRITPVVRVSGDSDQALARDPLAGSARLPGLAFETIRQGLVQGPVLIQVPRAGYLVALACQSCRSPVRCPHCAGPVRLGPASCGRQLQCGWCGRILGAQPDWVCPVCGSRTLRAPILGSARTAEELGRAFPGYRLIDSSGERVRSEVSEQPALVVATPGGEPVATHGYAAAVLLDAPLLLAREDLRAAEEALRRWLNAVALVRPAEAGGSVCLVGPAEARAVQALVRMDPAGFAARELADRREAGFPPAVRYLSCEQVFTELRAFAAELRLPDQAELLGPVPLPQADPEEPDWARLILRAPLSQARALTLAVRQVQALRTARKDPRTVRMQVDPVSLN